MPAATEEAIDVSVLREAAAWSLHYFLDPKRGAGKNFPNENELRQYFEEPNLKLSTVMAFLENIAGTTNLEELASDQKKAQEVLERVEGKKEETQEKITPTHAEAIKTAETNPQTAKDKVSALGILAEIDTVLANHRNSFSPKLTADISPKIREILPKLGIKNASDQVIAEVAQETARQTLEDVARIQNTDQLTQVIAEAVTQTIIAHPQISPKLKLPADKIYEKVFEKTPDIVEANKVDLGKAAVLGNLAQIEKLSKPNQETRDLVFGEIQQAVDTEAPLNPEILPSAQSAIIIYLQSYNKNLGRELATFSTEKLPNIEQLQKAKEAAHKQTFNQLKATANTELYKKLLSAKVNFVQLTDHVADILGLKPLTPQKIESLGLGRAQPSLTTFTRDAGPSGIVLTNPRIQEEVRHTLRAYDEPRLNSEIQKAAAQVEKFGKAKSLSYSDAKKYRGAKLRLQDLATSKSFPQKQPGRFKTYLSLFSPHTAAASNYVWSTDTALNGGYPGILVSKSLLANPHFKSGRTFGSLAFWKGNFRLGSPKPSFGMGKTITAASFGATIGVGIASGLMNKIVKTGAGVFGAAALYFLGLGQAAATGFIIGATIGGTAGFGVGAFLGFQVGVALAPFTFGLSIPIFTVLGALGGGFVGAAVMGIAGGLIGLGLAAGSATAVSMGVGAGVGGVVGAYIGFGVGGAVGGFIGGVIGSVIPFAGTAAGAAVGAAIGSAIGTAIGAMFGAATGAAIGYLVGNYVIAPITGAVKGIINGFGAGASAGGSFLGSIGSFFGGLISGGFNAVVGLGGSIISGGFGLLSSGIGSLVSGIGSFTSIGASFIGSIVGSAVGATGILSLITVTTVGAAFFSIASEEPQSPGQNQYFTVEKTANVTKLKNEQLPYDITFTIVLTVKDTDLENVTVTDQLNVQKEKASDSFTVTQDKDGNPISPINCPKTIPAGGNCTYSFIITADHRFDDSVINNTVKAAATPKGQSPASGEDTASVTIGNPPTCSTPCGWPTSGQITLGPNTGHHNEAIDIANSLDTTLYSTMTGRIAIVSYNDCTTQEFTAGECGPNKKAGNFINISGGGFRILYAHMNTISVSAGSDVTCSQKVGTMGYTGWTDPDDIPAGSHLHYDFKEGGNMAPPNIPQNPTVGITVTAPPSCIPGE